MALGIHFDNCGSLCAPVPSLLSLLVIYVELGQEGLGVTLVLDDQKARIELLSGGKIIVAVSLDL